MNITDYVDLGLACAEVCKALDRGMDGKKLDDLSQSVRGAIDRLTAWVKPAMHSLDNSPTMLLTAEPSRRSKRRSSNRANGMRRLDFSMRGTTRKQSPVGSQSSMVFFSSSPCVQSFPIWSPLSVLLQAELVINIHVNVSGMRGDMSKIREEIHSSQPVSASCST